MPKTSFAGVSGILDQSMGLAMQSERSILHMELFSPHMELSLIPSILPGSPLH